jgi:hypothetical protein
MGLSKLSITYKNKTDHYTLNNDLEDHVLDWVIENILKQYPKDARVIENILKQYPKDATTDIVDKIPLTELIRKTTDNIIII